MIETHHSRRINEAQQIAHQQRADVFIQMFRAVPTLLSTLRHNR